MRSIKPWRISLVKQMWPMRMFDYKYKKQKKKVTKFVQLNSNGIEDVMKTIKNTEKWWTDRVKEFDTSVFKHRRAHEECRILKIIFHGHMLMDWLLSRPLPNEEPHQSLPCSQTTQPFINQIWICDTMYNDLKECSGLTYPFTVSYA